MRNNHSQMNSMQNIMLTGHRKSGTSLLLRLLDRQVNANIFPTDFTFFYALFAAHDFEDQSDEKKIASILNIQRQNIIDCESALQVELIEVKRKFQEFFYNPLKLMNTISEEVILGLLRETMIAIDGNKQPYFVFKETSGIGLYHRLNENQKVDKIVCLIRHPISNIKSILKGRSYYSSFGLEDELNLASAMIRLKHDFKELAKAKSEVPIKIVRFEDLVNDTQSTVIDICSFCGLEFQDCVNFAPTMFGLPALSNNFVGEQIFFVGGHINQSVTCSPEDEIFHGLFSFFEDEIQCYWPETLTDNRLCSAFKPPRPEFSFDNLYHRFFFKSRFEEI